MKTFFEINEKNILYGLIIVLSSLFLLETIIFTRYGEELSQSFLRYGIVLSVLYIWVILMRFDLSIPDFSHFTPFILFVFSGFITLIFVPSISSGVRFLSIIGYMLLFLSIYKISDFGRLDKTNAFIIITAIFSCFVVFQIPFIRNTQYYLFNRFTGLTHNPNELAGILFLTASMIYTVFKLINKLLLKFISAILFLLTIIMLIYTGSKAGSLSLLLFISLSLINMRLITSIIFLPSLANLYAVFVIGIYDFLQILEDMIRISPDIANILRIDTTSLKYRLLAVKSFFDNYILEDFSNVFTWIFGSGLKRFDKETHSDNVYYLTLYEQGIVGLLFYLIFFLMIAYFRNRLKSNQVEFFASNLCLAIMFHSNYESRLFSGMNYMTLIFIIMYAIAIKSSIRQDRDD